MKEILTLILIWTSITVFGQAKNCNSIPMGAVPCDLQILKDKGDTTYAIVDTSDCWIYENNLSDGYWLVFSLDTSVVLKEFEIKDNFLNGIHTERYPNGNLMSREVYSSGTHKGPILHLKENGRLSSVGTQDSLEFIGISIWYWDNGMIAKSETWTEQTTFRNQITHYWDFDGMPISREEWEQIWNCK